MSTIYINSYVFGGATPIPGMAIWLIADTGLYQDAAGATPVAADSDPVGLWQDQSGNGNHASQSMAGSRPLWKTNALNGEPVLRGDGTHFMTLEPLVIGEEWTVFSIAARSAGTGIALVFDADGSDSTTPLRVAQLQRYNDANMESIAFNTAPSAFTDKEPITPANYNIMTAVRGAASIQAFVNGISNGATATTGTPASGSKGLSIFARQGAPGAYSTFLAGDIAEIIFYNSALSTADRETVETYLANKYGISLA